jgi:AraC-like DNA-binding protein
MNDKLALLTNPRDRQEQFLPVLDRIERGKSLSTAQAAHLVNLDPDIFLMKFREAFDFDYRTARLVPSFVRGKMAINSTAFSYYTPLRRVSSHCVAAPAARLSLSEAAGIACLEKTYFSKFFHAKVGVTYSFWLNVQRITHAMKILQAEDITVIRTAEQTGFDDVRTFERVFKRYTGTTPRRFRTLARPELYEQHLAFE